MAHSITFVLPGRSLAGGIRVIAGYGNALIGRGHRVTIVFLPRARIRRPHAWLRRFVHDARVRLRLDRDHLHDFAGRLVAARGSDLACSVPDGDVVIAAHWLTGVPVAALPASKGEKFSFIQGYEDHAFPDADIAAAWRLPLRKLVVSSWLRDLALERFGDSGARLVPNGIDLGLFDAPPRGLGHPPTVGVVYSPVPIKGTAVAFEAIRLARERVAGLKLICFGAMQPSTRCPLPPGIRFHLRPTQDRLSTLYAAADVWLCASEREGFALPPLEAMACRCPVVVTRCGGPMDYVEEGVNGYLVDVGDAEAMADRIVKVVAADSRWTAMSEAAYATRERFTLDAAVDRFEQAILPNTDTLAPV